VSGISSRRCAACGEVAVVSDHGRVKTVGETRYVETTPNGDTIFRCSGCGGLVTWEREPQKARK
jgi:hypothetical protein